MGVDISNLMQQVNDFFLHLYHQTSGAAPETTFLAFEPVGIPITLDMFKLHADDASYSQPLAAEQFSMLADTIPTINADVFQHTGKSIEDFYELLIKGAQHATPGSDESILFDSLKGQAQQEFDQIWLARCKGRSSFTQPILRRPSGSIRRLQRTGRRIASGRAQRRRPLRRPRGL